MNDDDVEISFIQEKEIKSFIRVFLNASPLVEQFGPVPPHLIDWKQEIKRFQEIFPREFNGEYKVDSRQMYTYMNSFIFNIVERMCEEEVKKGNLEVYWDSDKMDFVFKMSERYKNGNT